MANAPKITKITLDKVQYDIDLPSNASPVIDSLEVTRQLIVPVIESSNVNNLASMAANKGYVDTKNADLQEQINNIAAGSDVFDIVGTYAELAEYTNTKLNEGDVVKVLVDEQQNNATTYYRRTGNSWTLIGKATNYVLAKNDGNRVYIHNDAIQADLTYTTEAEAYTIVERTADGNIKLPSEITNDFYATSKKYVDDVLAKHNNATNPHNISRATLQLEHVVNTGDSNTPDLNGTAKFTTGGAYTLKTDLETKINNLDADNIVSGALPDERIASAETWNTQINTLTENVATNTSQLTEIESNISSINTEIDSLKTTIGDISSILDEINGEVI